MPNVKVDNMQESSKLVKKFKCNFCDRYFTRSEHRSRHELSHSSERPYKCPQCVSSFVRRDLLLRHCRTVHGSNVVPLPRKGKNRRTPSLDQPKDVRRPSAADSLLSLASSSHPYPEYPPPVDLPHSAPPPGPPPSGGGSGSPPAGHSGGPGPLMTGNHILSPGISATTPYRNDASPGRWYGQPPPLQNQAAKLEQSSHMPSFANYGQMLPQQVSGNGQNNHSEYSNGSGTAHSLGQGPLAGAHDEQLQTPVEPKVQPLSAEELGDLYHYFFAQSRSVDIQKLRRVAPDIDRASPVPQFGREYDATVFLSQLKSRPSIRADSSCPKDITRLALDRYLSAFFSFFHPTLPMFHLQTFDCRNANPYLLYSILAVGAILCHEEAIAQLFSYNSRIVLSFSANNIEDQLALAQTLVLIIIFASYTGDMTGSEIVNTKTTLLRVVDQLLQSRGLTSPNQKQRRQSSWHEWITDQVYMRTYYGTIVAITTLAALFNSPGVVIESAPMHMQLPCSEVIWGNRFDSEEEWRTRLEQELLEIPLITLGEMLEAVENVGLSDTPLPVLNPFSVRVLGNILFLKIADSSFDGNNTQQQERVSAQLTAWHALAEDPYPGMGQGTMFALQNLPLVALLKPLEYLGEQAYKFPQAVLGAMQDRQHPIIILSKTLLGVARLQTVLDMSYVRESLNFRSAQRVAEATLTCLGSLHAHDDEIIEQMTRVIIPSCDVIRASCLLGQRMFQSFLQSPLTGSIAGQCMVLAYELVLGLIIWCHRVEERMQEFTAHPDTTKALNPRLYKVYQWVTEMCSEAGIHKVYGTLAPALAESIAELYDSIKIWRIAEVMAVSLRLLSRGLLNSHSEMLQARYSQYTM